MDMDLLHNPILIQARRSSQVVSVPLVASDGRKLGSLEFSNGPSYGADVINSVTGAWLVASVFAIAIAALAGWFMSKRVTRPVLALEQGDAANGAGRSRCPGGFTTRAPAGIFVACKFIQWHGSASGTDHLHLARVCCRCRARTSYPAHGIASQHRTGT